MLTIRKYWLDGASLVLSLLFLAACKDKPTELENIPVALQITAPALSIYSGGTLQLAAVAKLNDGNTNDVTSFVKWSVQPGLAGRVTAAGLFISTSNVTGIETVRADYKGQTATLPIEVTKRAAFLTIWPVNTRVEAGRSLKFEAIAEFQDFSQAYVSEKVVWSIAPGIAATIDSAGTLHAKAGGRGIETVRGTYQTLTARSQANVELQFTSWIELVTIPAGSFVMGDDNGRADEKPAHEVHVDAFAIGKYEVTNAQYAAFLNEALAAGELFYESTLIIGKQGPFSGLIYTRLLGSFEFPDAFIQYSTQPGESGFRAVPGFGNYPVVRLNWYGAAAFCAFYGYRLPTEAEWEKACRGGQQLAYGTQDGSISHDLANYQGQGGRDTFEGLAPVGSFPPNPYGLYDMSGNAAEFVFDVYDAAYYAGSPRHNPIGPGPGMFVGTLPGGLAVWRGGAWIHPPSLCRAALRGTLPDRADHNSLFHAIGGFRVARSL
jgi:formylglycine-generating enzyme required for sulfatase activity